MNKFAFAALCAAPALAHAQGAARPTLQTTTPAMAPRIAVDASDDYEMQRSRAKAPRFDSQAEVRDQSRLFLGRIIELRGTVKGTFSRHDGFALMLQQPDGTLLLDAPNSPGGNPVRGNPLLRAGSFVRVLSRIERIENGEPMLALVNLTDRAEPLAILKADADDGVMLAPPSASAPAPDAVLLGDQIALPPAPGAGSASGKGSLPTPSVQSLAAFKPASAGNPYFGFTPQHRANYRAFIRRNSPKISEALADQIAGAILLASQTHNLDPRFLCAVVQVESDFDPTCLSSSGAMGLGQLMPFNLKPLGVKNAWDPQDNLLGSAKLLRQNLNTYSKQKDGTLLAVAAYHAGVGAVNRAGMKVPKATTQRYVWKVYYAYRALAPELFR